MSTLAETKDSQPPLLYPPYKSTVLRAPRRPLIRLPQTFSDFSAPVYGYREIGEADTDLTRQHAGEPPGERIIVAGRVLDEDGRPVTNTLIELWQCNAAGRYLHAIDDHPAPLDPNFTGADGAHGESPAFRGFGRLGTDRAGFCTFETILPGRVSDERGATAARHINVCLFMPRLLRRRRERRARR